MCTDCNAADTPRDRHLCTTCADSRKHDECRGGCGARLLKWYVLCQSCSGKSTRLEDAAPRKKALLPAMKGKGRSAGAKRQLELYQKELGNG